MHPVSRGELELDGSFGRRERAQGGEHRRPPVRLPSRSAFFEGTSFPRRPRAPPRSPWGTRGPRSRSAATASTSCGGGGGGGGGGAPLASRRAFSVPLCLSSHRSVADSRLPLSPALSSLLHPITHATPLLLLLPTQTIKNPHTKTVGRLARVLDLLGRGGRRARRDRHARRPRLGASCARSAAAARRPTARAPHPAVPLPAARARAVLGAMAAAVGRDAVSPLVFVSLPRALVLSFLVASPLTPRLPLKKNPQPNTAASTTATFAPADCPSGATSSPPSADAPPRPS